MAPQTAHSQSRQPWGPAGQPEASRTRKGHMEAELTEPASRTWWSRPGTLSSLCRSGWTGRRRLDWAEQSLITLPSPTLALPCSL